MMSKPEATKVILHFLTGENRPFSTNEVVEKCGKSFGKAVVQKSLEELVKSTKVTEKSIGNIKIFYVTQKVGTLEHKQDVERLKQKLSQTESLLRSKEAEYLQLETRLKTANKTPNIESLQEQHSQLLGEIREMKEKLQRLEIGMAEIKITRDEAKKIQNTYEKLTSAFRKRKRICNDMLDAILEGYPKSRKQLIEDIGVETDEAVGFHVDIAKR